MIRIRQIETPVETDAVRDLVREYVAYALTQDPNAKDSAAFIGLEEELAALPGIFGPPDGAFLLISVDGAPAGCVGLRRDSAESCEVKRMYVRPAFRGQGLGEALVAGLIAEARRLGYRRIVLDTFHTLATAHHLYRKAGFRDVPPAIYLPDSYRGKVLFMELVLA